MAPYLLCVLVGVRGWQRVSFSVVLYHIKGTSILHLNPELAASASLASLALALPEFQTLGSQAGCHSRPEVTWCESELRFSYLNVKCFTH